MGALLGFLVFILWAGFIFFIGLMWWKIVKKTGYHGALGILLLVPIANIIMMAILAFKEWPIQKESKGGEIKSPSSLPTPLIVVIVIVAILPIFALLAAIAIPNLLRARLVANEASTKATVRTISTAIESYSAANNGQYPVSEYDLKKANYLPEYYDKSTKFGYVYSLSLNQNDYEIIATPQTCGTTGTKVFIAQKNGNLSERNCK